jgi:hypothetical protein
VSRDSRKSFTSGVRIGYCLPESTLRPGGYFTMNCSTDGDCLGGSVCEGSYCVMPCRSDDQCDPPTTTCAPDTLKPRYCGCYKCPAPPPQGLGAPGN